MLNNEDKKYLKENIERRLDKIEDRLDGSNKNVSEQSVKVLSEQEKAQKFREEISKKFNSLYKDQKTPDEKKDYKHNLQKLDDMGIATLAEKVELLKLQIKDSVPKEFTDAVKQSGKLAKQGANQALKGASNLVGKAMSLNPLTAMIWAQRGLVGDVANIGIGSVKAVTGGVGTLAGGVGKLTSAALAMLPKPKIKQTNDEETPTDETTNEETGLFASNAKKVEEIEETEDGGAKQLSDLHKLFVKGDYLKKRDERDKESQNIMSKGLGVMAKGINGINTVVSSIMSKQKLIASTLLIGALGILALVGWYKNGGMDSMIDKLKSSLASDEGKQAREDADNYVKSELTKIKNDATSLNGLTTSMGLQKLDSPQNAKFKVKPGMNLAEKEFRQKNAIINAYTKSGVSAKNADFLYSKNKGGYTTLSQGFYKPKNKQGLELKLPFPVRISTGGIWDDQDDKDLCFVQLARGTGANAKIVVFAKVYKSSVTNKAGKTIKSGETVLKASPDYWIQGDWASFMGGTTKDAEQTLLEERAESIVKKANEIMNKPYGANIASKQLDKGFGVYKQYDTKHLKEQYSNPDFKSPEEMEKEKRQEEIQEFNEANSSSSNTGNTNRPNTTYKEMTPKAQVKPLPTLNVNQENLSTKTNDEAKQVKATGTHTIAPETSESNATKQQKSQINIKAPNKPGSKGIPGEYLSTSQYYAATAAK